jgi:hypothetical protein
MVQGYRYLGNAGTTTSHPQEAAYFGLWEALQWVFRLDFQIVWIVGSTHDVFRQVLGGNSLLLDTADTSSNNDSNSTTPMMRYLHKHIVGLMDRARCRRIQFKFLASDDTQAAMDLATRAVMQQKSETCCHWETIHYQCQQRQLPFAKTMASQVSI